MEGLTEQEIKEVSEGIKRMRGKVDETIKVAIELSKQMEEIQKNLGQPTITEQ